MSRSLNKVELIGNLTRDPELRYTPSGTAVCTFGLATNRSWNTDSGEKKEEVEFHRIVAWNKLAELCSQFLVKGRKVYVQGRIATRNWTGQDGQARTTVEIVIDDMILLDSARSAGQATQPSKTEPEEHGDEEAPKKPAKPKQEEKAPHVTKQKEKEQEGQTSEDVSPDDIPF
ncbi:MAG: single-stranded DNA-binding protein [bacterium]|nr:single-stranded DNA-binding protein [bacterium]